MLDERYDPAFTRVIERQILRDEANLRCIQFETGTRGKASALPSTPQAEQGVPAPKR